MRKITLLIAALLVAISAMAIPAHREPVTITQPDGTKLTIKLIGDEFYHFNTTLDGYTIVKNDAGVYVYAQRDGEGLKASAVKAHDEMQRTDAEKAFLSTTAKYMTDREAHAAGEAKRVKRDGPAQHSPAIDVKKFRGLVILINLTDKKFAMKDPNGFYNDMLNTKGFTGYTDDSGKWVSCTGSMHDYYSENSNGIFQPQFDVVGPIDVNYSCYDFKGTSYASSIFLSAVAKASAQGVDFSKYDADNNGYIDMIFFQVAGLSSSFGGNDSRLLWPHKSSFWSSSTYSGKRLGTYACSTELYGWSDAPSTITVEGIGTMCHEFTHVMGFPDLYDTDYEGNGGESHHPGEWDIMAGGGSFNSGRTPCGFSIFERYFMGFANPKVISGTGHYVLNPISSNEGYILKTPVLKEYFIIDNRQKTRWDYYLPGHGMIIARVDSTATSPWSNNRVNAYPSHNYYELLRAGNSPSGASPSDPFPGSKSVVMVSSTTTPSLKTWTGLDNPYMLNKITENGGVIEFDVDLLGNLTSLVEDFEGMPLSTGTTSVDVPGKFATWTLGKDKVVAPGVDYCEDGVQALATFGSGVATMTSDVYCDEIYRIEASVKNPTTSDSKFRLSASVDGGKTWATLSPDQSAIIGQTTKLAWTMSYKCPVRFRFNTTTGSKTNACYLDNLQIFYEGEQHEIKPFVKGDANGDGVVDITDANIIINIMLGKDSASNYNGRADVNGDGAVDITDVNIIINIMLGKE